MDLSGVLRDIEDVVNDHSTPRRIKENLSKIKKDLEDKDQDPAVKVTSAVYEIEDIANDVNIPMHVKTVLWDLISSLEAVKSE